MAGPERFELNRSARWLILVAPWIMSVLALLSAALPALPDDGKSLDEAFLLGVAIFGCIGFGLSAWYLFKIVRRLPEAAISVDEDGLWPTIKDKQIALVPWDRIVQLLERNLMQRLELLDRTGKVIARLEYELRDFPRLRSIVLQRAKLEQVADPALGVYKKSTWHHLFSIGSLIGFVVLGWYVGPTQPLIGYGGMALLVAVIAREYATTPFRLRVTSSALEIDSPCRRKRVPKERVSRIEIEDELVNHARHPRVTVHLSDASKPIHLKALGPQSVELYRILRAWRDEV